MTQSIVPTCFWIMLKSIMTESLFVCISLMADGNIFAGIGFGILGCIVAAVVCTPLLLFVCPIVRAALVLPYSFRAQMVWLTFALTAFVEVIFLIPFEMSSGKMDETYARILISICLAITIACWTSKNSLKEIRQNLNPNVADETL